ncbi:flagellar basal body P-ring formation chaperone FlgA [Phenylobacterium sp.]|jgi:flagella basal body P-ring formation protein FlgA|uniref:flagellar basal body P-ring formation chaperone FlgA n=1 Tax=Phenylobacterium sp. TaxID=1871053 RepID=UPI002F421B77
MRLALTLIAAALAVAGPALAGRPVSLKADTTSADAVVTLGDLFDGAGAAGRLAVAQRTASTVVLDAAAVQAAARRAGLDWDNPDHLRKLVVRAGISAPSAPIARSVSGSPAAAQLGASAARGEVEVLTYARSLNAGELVQPTDLAWAKAVAAPADSPSDPDQVIGMATRRPVRSGAVVMARDVGAAVVVRSGDLVIVTYDSGGVSLSLEGKAMGSAGVGDTLQVQNTQSRKIIQVVVSGPGTAVVGPAALEIKSNRTTRYAAR